MPPTMVEELNEVLSAQEATMTRIFGEDSATRQIRRSADWNRRVIETANFMADVQEGRSPRWLFWEAMTRSDFPLLLGDVMNRQLLGEYTQWPSVWPSIARRRVVNDFRPANSFSFDSNDRGLPE